MDIINLRQNSISGVCVAGCCWPAGLTISFFAGSLPNEMLESGLTTDMISLGEMRLSGTIAVNGTFSASIGTYIVAVTDASNAAVTASI